VPALSLRRYRPNDRHRGHADPWRRLKIGFVVLFLVEAFGTLGYMVLGLSFFDAVYQTAITVTTVGFAEVGGDETDTAYRMFTLVLVLIGAGGVLYTLGVLFEAMVEGSINDGFRVRRTERMIDQMQDHIIVAGAGRVGKSIARYVAHHDADVVIIDRNRELVDFDVGVVVVGEATDDDVLREAGVDHARILIAALNSDADNVYVTLTARAMNPDLFIAVRTNHQGNESTFVRAGANRVVNPHEIGGSRMGAIAMHPNVAEFLDEVLHDTSHDVQVEEFAVGADSSAVGLSTQEITARLDTAPLLLAVRHPDGAYEANPGDQLKIDAGDVVIALGSAAELGALRRFNGA